MFYLSETLNGISVVTGPGSFDLANNIAKSLQAELAVASVRIFSDGESSLARCARTALLFNLPIRLLTGT